MQASDFWIEQVLRCCNGFVTTIDGRLALGMRLPGGWPRWHFDEHLYDQGTLTITEGSTDRPNRLRVWFTNVFDEYRRDAAFVDDEMHQRAAGRVVEDGLTLDGCARMPQAEMVGTVAMREKSADRRHVRFDLGFVGMILAPGDIIALSARPIGLDRLPVGITELEEDEGGADDGPGFTVSGRERQAVLGALRGADVPPPPPGGTGGEPALEPGECELAEGGVGTEIVWFNNGAAYPAVSGYIIRYVEGAYRLDTGAVGEAPSFGVEGYDVVTFDADGNVVVLIAAPAMPTPWTRWRPNAGRAFATFRRGRRRVSLQGADEDRGPTGTNMNARHAFAKALAGAMTFGAFLLTASGQAAPQQEKSLYERLGGVFAIASVVDHFSDAVVENPKVGKNSPNPALREWHTKNIDRLAGLKFMRTLWVCEVTGGPFKFSATEPGRSHLGLEEAHRDLKISPEEFDEVAAELGRSLDFAKVPARDKAEVLAAFAAHKDEVTAGHAAH